MAARAGVAGLAVAALAPAAPAAAQYLIYEGPTTNGPLVYERPPADLPEARPGLRYVMLPPVEVRRRLRGMGYWQVSRPHLAGRVYMVTAMDEEGPVRLRLDAYSGEVLGVQPLPGGSARLPAAPAVPQGMPRGSSEGGSEGVLRAPPPRRAVPLPPTRPPEADLATVTPQDGPASVEAALPAAAPSAASGSAPSPSAVAPVTPSAPATVPAGVAGSEPSPVLPEPQVARASRESAVSSVAPPAPASTGAGTATPGTVDAGSASVLSRSTGTP